MTTMLAITAITALALLVGTSAPAHAYIDPGSGSYMLQLAMAGLLAVVFSLKMSWQRVRSTISARMGGRNSLQRRP
jgi:hypothetical protein